MRLQGMEGPGLRGTAIADGGITQQLGCRTFQREDILSDPHACWEWDTQISIHLQEALDIPVQVVKMKSQMNEGKMGPKPNAPRVWNKKLWLTPSKAFS